MKKIIKRFSLIASILVLGLIASCSKDKTTEPTTEPEKPAISTIYYGAPYIEYGRDYIKYKTTSPENLKDIIVKNHEIALSILADTDVTLTSISFTITMVEDGATEAFTGTVYAKITDEKQFLSLSKTDEAGEGIIYDEVKFGDFTQQINQTIPANKYFNFKIHFDKKVQYSNFQIQYVKA